MKKPRFLRTRLSKSRRKNHHFLVASFGVGGILLAFTHTAFAAEYYLGGADTPGTSSFTNPLTGAAAGWKLDNAGASTAPTAGNNYTVGGPLVGGVAVGVTLRAPTDANSYTFAGDTLSLLTGGRFLFKSTSNTQVITVNNLVLNGGTLDYAPDGSPGGTLSTLAGTLTLGSSSSTGGIGASSGKTLVVNSTITGVGALTISGAGVNAGGATGSVTLNGTNDYTGGTNVRGGTVKLGNSSALGSTAALLSVTGGTLDLTANNITQDRLVLGGGYLTSTGGSALTLTSTANAITLSGTVAYPFATPAGAASAAIKLTGATGGNIVKSATVGNPVIAGALDLGGVSRSIALADTAGDAAPELTFSDIISNGGITLDNTVSGASTLEWGSLLLSGNNTYDGVTNITMGRLEINKATSLGSTVGGTNIGTRGTLAFGGSGQTIIGGITVAENLTINRTVTGTYGLVAIQNNSGANTLSGTVSLAATAQVDVGGGSLAFTNNITETAVAGLTKSGNAQMTLSGNNSYSGITTVLAGELVVASNNALGTTAGGTAVGTVNSATARLTLANGVAITGEAITLDGTGGAGANGGALQAAANAAASWAGDVTLGTVGLTGTNARIGAQALGTLTLTGVIKNGSATNLDISGIGGTGTVILKGANTYTGITTVIRGNLILDGGSINSGADVLIASSGSSEVGTFTMQNGASIFANTITLGNSPGGLQTNNATWTQTGGTTESKQWTSFGFNGKGTAKAVINGGTLNVKTVAATGTQSLEVGVFDTVASTLSVSNGASVNLQNNADIAIGSQNNSANNVLNQDGGFITFYSDGGTTTGGTGLLKIGQNGTGNNSYNLNGGTLTANSVTRTSITGTGTFNFNGGILRAATTGVNLMGNLTRANIRDAGAIIDTNGNNVTLSQALEASDVSGDTGTGGLTKQGSGVLTLTGGSTYAGATVVSAGSLLVNGSLGNSAVSVLTATLGGTGTITGSVNVTGGGSLSPGASVESLATGAVTMTSGSTFVYEATDNGATGADLLAVAGSLSLTDVSLNLLAANLSGGPWTAGDKLTLISYTGAPINSGFTGFDDDAIYEFGANQWQFNYDDSTKGANFASDATGTSFVTLTAVPEPSAMLLGALGLLALVRRRR